MTARRLIVWRHGETGYNAEDRVQGQTDVELNERGRAQAAAAAAVLATAHPAAIVASDLIRAAHTARALAEITGLKPTFDPDLREIHCGDWEGLLRREVEAGWPGALDEDELTGALRRGGHGESVLEVADRAEKALRRAADTVEDGATVVVASHGLAGAAGVAQLVGLPARGSGLRTLRNCHWITVERGRWSALDPSLWQITEWNVGAWPAATPPAGTERGDEVAPVR